MIYYKSYLLSPDEFLTNFWKIISNPFLDSVKEGLFVNPIISLHLFIFLSNIVLWN